ncbi:hypothetical protein ScalyP_jg3700 [Parmales sp. scaly parma]|nr:hypothetical protein ScalyP_jg3700 [Parmales sp. scaly parma]
MNAAKEETETPEGQQNDDLEVGLGDTQLGEKDTPKETKKNKKMSSAKVKPEASGSARRGSTVSKKGTRIPDKEAEAKFEAHIKQFFFTKFGFLSDDWRQEIVEYGVFISSVRKSKVNPFHAHKLIEKDLFHHMFENEKCKVEEKCTVNLDMCNQADLKLMGQQFNGFVFKTKDPKENVKLWMKEFPAMEELAKEGVS